MNATAEETLGNRWSQPTMEMMPALAKSAWCSSRTCTKPMSTPLDANSSVISLKHSAALGSMEWMLRVSIIRHWMSMMFALRSVGCSPTFPMATRRFTIFVSCSTFPKYSDSSMRITMTPGYTVAYDFSTVISLHLPSDVWPSTATFGSVVCFTTRKREMPIAMMIPSSAPRKKVAKNVMNVRNISRYALSLMRKPRWKSMSLAEATMMIAAIALFGRYWNRGIRKTMQTSTMQEAKNPKSCVLAPLPSAIFDLESDPNAGYAPKNDETTFALPRATSSRLDDTS
mmetsp:Transcript_14454/g.56835  ORF Transcript_14454/g.56835 Transcript_14454/m.56835 type:complete len:285 (-) Transcript_14454:1550-2404(-)